MPGSRNVSRRTFVRMAAVATAGLAAGSCARLSPLHEREVSWSPKSGGVHALGSHRHLFIDHWLTDRHEHITLRVNPPQVRELVLIADKPWEKGGITNYCNVFWDDLANEYKLY